MSRSRLLRPVRPAEARLLESWARLLPEGARPLFLTACGDWFLEGPRGEILFLDTAVAVWLGQRLTRPLRPAPLPYSA